MCSLYGIIGVAFVSVERKIGIVLYELLMKDRAENSRGIGVKITVGDQV
jgi:hypothetical protein